MITRLRAQLVITAILGLSMTAATSDAGFIVSLDGDDLTATRTGANPVMHSIDVLLTHDDSGENTLSGLTIDITLVTPLTLEPNGDPVNPLGFADADIGANGSAAFSNFTDIAVTDGSTNLLTTLDVMIPGTAADGRYLIQLSVFEAFRGGVSNPTDITGEFTANGGNLDVVTVPEPTSPVCLVAALTGCGLLRRRQR